MDSMGELPAVHMPSRRDAQVVVGLAAILESLTATGDLSPFVESMLRDRLVDHGLVSPDGPRIEVRQALSDLNHRFRYVLGEYPTPPNPIPVPPLAEY